PRATACGRSRRASWTRRRWSRTGSWWSEARGRAAHARRAAAARTWHALSSASGVDANQERCMNAAQVHLLLNHVPIIGAILATILLAVGIGMRSNDVLRVTLGLFAVLALAGAVVYLTGEPAEELVEDVPGVEHETLE